MPLDLKMISCPNYKKLSLADKLTDITTISKISVRSLIREKQYNTCYWPHPLNLDTNCLICKLHKLRSATTKETCVVYTIRLFYPTNKQFPHSDNSLTHSGNSLTRSDNSLTHSDNSRQQQYTTIDTGSITIKQNAIKILKYFHFVNKQ